MQIMIMISLQFLRRVNEKKYLFNFVCNKWFKRVVQKDLWTTWMLNHLNELEI